MIYLHKHALSRSRHSSARVAFHGPHFSSAFPHSGTTAHHGRLSASSQVRPVCLLILLPEALLPQKLSWLLWHFLKLSCHSLGNAFADPPCNLNLILQPSSFTSFLLFYWLPLCTWIGSPLGREFLFPSLPGPLCLMNEWVNGFP